MSAAVAVAVAGTTFSLDLPDSDSHQSQMIHKITRRMLSKRFYSAGELRCGMCLLF